VIHPWFWLDMGVLMVGSFVLGWNAHLWLCMRRKGCPVWLEEDARVWNPKAELNGWHRRRKRPALVPDEAWQGWRPAPPVDSENETGIPSQRRDTPTAETDVANKDRRTP
jgi:hypothetical protein